MGVSLYRQYRPQKFSDVSGQTAAIEILTRSLSGSRIGHAYLFSGPRGCGKTTIARILAKALNCLEPLAEEPCCTCRSCLAIAAGESLDVVEIDGASNNSVDEVRELKTHVALAPFTSRYKVYIIDEVHMLSTAAFNALLKTLEEPPAYVVFVLATTEPHKVPVTIRSRCQHIPFRSIATRQIFDRLRQILEWEGADAQDEALWEIARQADGALRDALSMLEQVVNRGEGHVFLEDVEATLGGGSRSALERWFSALRDQESASFTEMQRMMTEGSSPERILEELFSLVRNLWLVVRWPDVLASLEVSDQERTFLKEEYPHWSETILRGLMGRLVDLLGQARMGIRSDILTGLLMLGVSQAMDPNAETFARSIPPTSFTVKEREAPRCKKSLSPPASPPQGFETHPAETLETTATSPSDCLSPQRLEGSAFPEEECPLLSQELREELLALALHKDFVLFCGLLDGIFRVSEGQLLLELAHRYVYEVLSLSRYRSSLAEIFQRYDRGVLLRWGEYVTSCVSGKDENGDGTAERDEPLLSPEPSPEAEPEDAPHVGEGTLPFDGLVREVARWMNGEVVLVKRGLDDGDDGTVAAEEKDDE